MAEVEQNDKPSLFENGDIVNDESSEKFQKFIYDLFDKNGILCDLRAYLRKQIVALLKNAHTGTFLNCQKHFTQRLQLKFQALNMLVAEYLLRMEFNYSLSVFVSELPLANMMFGFSKALHQYKDRDSLASLRFAQDDVCSVLHYLGVKCDGEHVINIVNMYERKEQPSLLLCILSCLCMYTDDHPHLHSSEENLSSMSTDTVLDKPKTPRHKCKHFAACKYCKRRESRLKEKYKRKKNYFAKNSKHSDSTNVLMQNIDSVEGEIIEEMFEQLRSVYEDELRATREKEEKILQRSMAALEVTLQQREREMEESYKRRESELVRNIREKKKFLWGLARALREQHDSMARAMADVTKETERLTEKEQSLKQQIAEAEQVLKQRGEDMRRQICEELAMLERHLDCMRKERDSISKERQELEHLKSLTQQDSCLIKAQDLTTEDHVKSHYSLLKDELNLLRKYLESTKMEPKCVIERSTITEVDLDHFKSCTSLNNEHSESHLESSPASAPPHQLYNDLKKHKNINFKQPLTEDLQRVSSHKKTHSSASIDAGNAAEQHVYAADMKLLREENQMLRTIAEQQRVRIECLTQQQARLNARVPAVPHGADTARPRTTFLTVQGVNPSMSANAFGWRKGAGEEWGVFADAQPMVVLPGDRVPFIGRAETRTDSRRHLINQWRLLRRRVPPTPSLHKTTSHRDAGSHSTRKKSPTSSSQRPDATSFVSNCRTEVAYPATTHPCVEEADGGGCAMSPPARDKSPKTVLKEAKQKLRNNLVRKEAACSRDKSPGAILREAKLRLRKLEIEAEAVEASYRDFRRRQELRNKDNSLIEQENQAIDGHRKNSLLKIYDTIRPHSSQAGIVDTQEATNRGMANNIGNYGNKHNFSETHFNRNIAGELVKPIPKAFSEITNKPKNLLDTPLTKFRNLYNSNQSSTLIRNSLPKRTESKSEMRASSSTDLKDEKKELEILEKNINKLYNLKDKQPLSDTPPLEKLQTTPEVSNQEVNESDVNLLIVEVEKISKTNDVKLNQENVLVVVESDIDTRDLIKSNVDLGEIDNKPDIGSPSVLSPYMTILISPRLGEDSPNSENSPKGDGDNTKSTNEDPLKSKSLSSSRKDTKLSTNEFLDSLNKFGELSSVDLQLDVQKRQSLNIVLEDEKDLDDYLDDFSADVDNYNSNSDENSHISQAIMSEDENFWGS